MLVQRLVAKPEHNGKRARVVSFDWFRIREISGGSTVTLAVNLNIRAYKFSSCYVRVSLAGIEPVGSVPIAPSCMAPLRVTPPRSQAGPGAPAGGGSAQLEGTSQGPRISAARPGGNRPGRGPHAPPCARSWQVEAPCRLPGAPVLEIPGRRGPPVDLHPPFFWLPWAKPETGFENRSFTNPFRVRLWPLEKTKNDTYNVQGRYRHSNFRRLDDRGPIPASLPFP